MALWPERLLRAGVAFAFLYPALDALVDPVSWLGYMPHALRGIVPDALLLHGFGLLEVIIALWLLSGWRVRWPALAAAAILLVIVALNLADFQIVFRDIAIAAAALALALAPQERVQ